jgi:hypothetical protein
MMAWAFLHPMQMSTAVALWLILPLLAGAGIVYKTLRVHDLRRLPLQVVWLWAEMVAGVVILAVALYLLLIYVA